MPLLAECASYIGDVQVRNRGTMGGSLAHADPAADYPAAILALEAEIQTAKSRRTRLHGGKLLRGYAHDGSGARRNSHGGACCSPGREDRLRLSESVVPASGFAVVGVAAVVTLDAKGQCAKVRVGITGAASKAFRAYDTETALMGKTPDDNTIAQAALQATNGIETNGDIFASAEYRAHLAQVYAKRALAKA